MVDFGFDSSDILDERSAVTPFEELLLAAIQQKVPEKHFRNVFLQTQFYVCESKHADKHNPNVKKPLVITTEHGLALAVFSSKYRTLLFQDEINNHEILWGRDLIIKVSDNIGIILNPKCFLSFQISAQGVQKIKDELL